MTEPKKTGLASILSRYDTALPPKQENAFRRWAGERIRDTEDYDLRGAWLANTQADGRGHMPDTYKKPNHPTFSAESQYSTQQTPGGQWTQDSTGRWVFWASPHNIDNMGLGALVRYFDQYERGNTVVAPFNYKLPGRK